MGVNSRSSVWRKTFTYVVRFNPDQLLDESDTDEEMMRQTPANDALVANAMATLEQNEQMEFYFGLDPLNREMLQRFLRPVTEDEIMAQNYVRDISPVRRYPCRWILSTLDQVCGDTYPSKDSLLAHIKVEHMTVRRGAEYQCMWSRCRPVGQCFSLRDELVDHVRVHIGWKPFWCQTGRNNDLYPGEGDPHDHPRVHASVRPYKCWKVGCNQRFRSTVGRRAHFNRHINQPTYPCNTHRSMPRFIPRRRTQRQRILEAAQNHFHPTEELHARQLADSQIFAQEGSAPAIQYIQRFAPLIPNHQSQSHDSSVSLRSDSMIHAERPDPEGSASETLAPLVQVAERPDPEGSASETHASLVQVPERPAHFVQTAERLDPEGSAFETPAPLVQAERPGPEGSASETLAPMVQDPERPATLGQASERPVPMVQGPERSAPLVQDPEGPAPMVQAPDRYSSLFQAPGRPVPVVQGPKSFPLLVQALERPVPMVQTIARHVPLVQVAERPAPLAQVPDGTVRFVQGFRRPVQMGPRLQRPVQLVQPLQRSAPAPAINILPSVRPNMVQQQQQPMEVSANPLLGSPMQLSVVDSVLNSLIDPFLGSLIGRANNTRSIPDPQAVNEQRGRHFNLIRYAIGLGLHDMRARGELRVGPHSSGGIQINHNARAVSANTNPLRGDLRLPFVPLPRINNPVQVRRPVPRERQSRFEPRLFYVQHERDGRMVMAPYIPELLGGDEMAPDGRRPLRPFSPNSFYDTTDESDN